MIYLSFFSLFLLLSSLMIFFFGYVPKTNYKKKSSQNQIYFAEKTIDKVILVIVDSLRADMVYNKKDIWSNLYRNINKSWTYSTIAKLQPPSMSLPKIKSMITGSVINFVDVIFNTDAGKIAQENLIDILRKYRDFKFFLFGDETWSKLFPYQFNYSFLSPPFYVRDFYDIDKKISEHIPKIISNVKAWDFVIMHYVGLDHIGHSVGPYGSYINSKLSEMDSSINTLINGFFEKDINARNMLILTADHGMSDLGGHGGSSSGELNVPLIFINYGFSNNSEIIIENISQNDIAPSLAILLGVPIPSDSIGVIPYRLLCLIKGSNNRIKALFSNYAQLIKNTKNLPISIEKRFFTVNFSIFETQQNCNIKSSTLCIKKLEEYQKELIDIMIDIKDILKTQFIFHNFVMLEWALIFSFTSFLICVSICMMDLGMNVTFPGFIFFLSITFLFILSLIYENFKNCFFTSFKINIIVLMIILTGHTTSGAMDILRFVKTLILEAEVPYIVVVTTLLINSISFSFSNVLREEHEVWFYISSTLLILYVINKIIQKIILKKETVQLKSTYVSGVLILMLDRFLRILNRHGESWSTFQYLDEWLNSITGSFRYVNSYYLLTIMGFCFLVVGWQFWQNNLLFLSVICELLMIFNCIHRLGDIYKNQHLSDISVWIYYILLLIYIGFSFSFKYCLKNNFTFKLSDIILLISILICREQNVILWTCIVIKRLFFHKIWFEDIQLYNVGIQFIIFNIIGMTSYYQQGNSNSLSTIDVQPGFNGMSAYVAFIVDPLVAIHLFSTNLFWIFTWLEWLSEFQVGEKYQSRSISLKTEFINENKVPDNKITKPKNQSFSKVVHFLTTISSLFTIVLFMVSTRHKHTFSAWSIYAPKLLFHCFHYGILLVLYIFIAKWNFFEYPS